MGLKQNIRDTRTRWLTLGTLASSALTFLGVVLAITTIIVGPGDANSLTTLATVLIVIGSIGSVLGAIMLNHRSKSIRP
ncbi:MAG: hypothetical protein U1E32_02235 [Rhodoglobus sp.]|nr:hypothetical protein [Rhodoglobus sp.]